MKMTANSAIHLDISHQIPGYHRSVSHSAVNFYMLSFMPNLQLNNVSLSQGVVAASGNRNRTSGGLNNVGSNGNVWSAGSNSAANAYNLNFNSGSVNPVNNNNRSNGFSLRPVSAFADIFREFHHVV